MTLDTRRPLRDGKFLVRVYVYEQRSKKFKRYATDFSFHPDEFQRIWIDEKPGPHYKKVRAEMLAVLDRAKSCAEAPFSFDGFEAKFLNKPQTSLEYYFNQSIDNFIKAGSLGTATWYRNALKSITLFGGLGLYQITPQWLQDYDNWMKSKGKSKTTTAMYLRALRAVLNRARLAGADIGNPFAQFKIKEGGKIKKAISPGELKLLYSGSPQNSFQAKAKAFWFFTYFCNGLNVKDIVSLKYSQMGEDGFSFERGKTGALISVVLNDYCREVIKTYGNQNTGPKQYVFPFLKIGMTAEQKRSATYKLTWFINQHFKKYAKSVGVDSGVGTYAARHSFATGLIRSGMPTAFVQEALGHTTEKTTQRYLAGFMSEDKRKAAKLLLEGLE